MMHLLEQRDVVTVSRHAGHDPAADGPPEQEEVPHDVEHLVSSEFAVQAQFGIHHPVVTDQDAVVQSPASGQAHLLERGDVLHEPEGTGRSALRPERLRAAVTVADALEADRGGLVEGVIHLEALSRLQRDVLALFGIPDRKAPIHDQHVHHLVLHLDAA